MRKSKQKDNHKALNKSEIFEKYKKYFIAMFIMIAVFVTCFFLTSFNVLPLWAIDIILVPIVLIAVAVWHKAKKEK